MTPSLAIATARAVMKGRYSDGLPVGTVDPVQMCVWSLAGELGQKAVGPDVVAATSHWSKRAQQRLVAALAERFPEGPAGACVDRAWAAIVASGMVNITDPIGQAADEVAARFGLGAMPRDLPFEPPNGPLRLWVLSWPGVAQRALCERLASVCRPEEVLSGLEGKHWRGRKGSIGLSPVRVAALRLDDPSGEESAWQVLRQHYDLPTAEAAWHALLAVKAPKPAGLTQPAQSRSTETQLATLLVGATGVGAAAGYAVGRAVKHPWAGAAVGGVLGAGTVAGALYLVYLKVRDSG